MRQFEQTLGVVENIDTTSRQLKEALELGKTIIVTTLQKFPVIAKEIGELPRQALRRDRGRGALVANGREHQEPQGGARLRLAGGGGARRGRGRNAGGGAREHDPRRNGEARAAAEPVHLRLHRHAQAEDARTVRPEARRRQIPAVPPLQHAPGDRGRLHPRRARELHDLFGLLAPVEEDRERSALRQEEGRIPAQVVRRAAPARDRREGADHGRSTSPPRCRARSAARPRR